MIKENIGKFDHCYGCGVCAAICAHKVIALSLKDGFYSPIVDEGMCSGCGLCLTVCPFDNKAIALEQKPVKSFAAFSGNPDNRERSSSGGLLYELACLHVNNGGVFCGVSYNAQKERAEHYFAQSIEDLDKSRGSKYIQSFTADAFSSFNKTDRYLVVGTPCQIDGLRRFLQKTKREDQFVLVDFFCHGVPSALMWHKYVSENIPDAVKIHTITFRDKSDGWHNSFRIKASGKDKENIAVKDKGEMFYKFFFSHRCMNKVCFKDCKYKYTNSSADIRAGDLWGTKYAKDEKGVSGCVVFSKKGEELIGALDGCVFVEEVFETVAEAQIRKPLQKPLTLSLSRRLLKGRMSLSAINSISLVLEKTDPRFIWKKLKYYFCRAFQIARKAIPLFFYIFTL